MNRNYKLWNIKKILEITYTLFLLLSMLFGIILQHHYKSTHVLLVTFIIAFSPIFLASLAYVFKSKYKKIFIWLCISSILLLLIQFVVLLTSSQFYYLVIEIDNEILSFFQCLKIKYLTMDRASMSGAETCSYASDSKMLVCC